MIGALASSAAVAVLAAARRLARRPVAALLLVVGLAVPIAVPTGLAIYGEAAGSRLFDQQLAPDASDADAADAANDAEALTVLYSLNRLSGGSRAWDEVAPLDDVMFSENDTRLPLAQVDRLVETRPLGLFVGAEQAATAALSSVTGIVEWGEVVEGRFPTETDTASDAPIEAIIELGLAELEGITVGSRLSLVPPQSSGVEPFTVDVVGVWTDRQNGVDGAVAAEPPFGGAESFRRRLLIDHDVFVGQVAPRLGAALENVRWRLTLDADRLESDDVSAVLGALDRLENRAELLVPGTRELRSPAGTLREVQRLRADLDSGLASFSVPLLVLALAVGLLLVAVNVRGRVSELTTLRRRGVPRRVLAATGVPDALIVAALAFAAALPLAFAVAALLARTSSFFRFGATGPALALTSDAVRSALVMAAVVFVVQLLPLLALVLRLDSRKGAAIDADDRPWWQRSYLDLVVILLVGVVTYRGVQTDGGRAELLDDPAVVLLPAAAAVASGLLVLRLMPVLMGALGLLVERTNATAMLVALRRAARAPADLSAPLLLLVVTASLATFTASLAITLDLQLADDSLHRTGAVARLIDRGSPAPVISEPTVSAGASRAAPNPPRSTTRHAPLDAYERVWGVRAASPTIELTGTGVYASGSVSSLAFVGVEPTSFAQVAYWRSDYADRSLVELMTALDASPRGVLVAESLTTGRSLDVGSELRLDLLTEGGQQPFPVVIVGTFTQFPRWYPDVEPPLVVGHARAVEAIAGATHDRFVLFEADPEFGDRNRVINDLQSYGASRPVIASAADAIERENTTPGRQGVLGLLTLGVALATLLTLLGCALSTTSSVRRRGAEIGALRAMGMSRREVTAVAVADLLIVMLIGLATAIALGVGFARVFIPLLVDTAPGSAPELLPAIAWRSALAVAVSLLALLILTSAFVVFGLRRARVYEAIRVGEQ